MRIEVNNCEYEANTENTAIFTGSTLLNGIYTDLDDDYVFIPENDSQEYANVVVRLVQEDITAYRMDGYDPNAQPFCFIISALCRQFRNELDELKVED
jgi:hypothetical protein